MVAAGGATDTAARAALDELCRLYWFPIYAFARRRGHDEHTAKDLAQGFFLQLIDRNSIAQADANRGKFRSFLLACFKNHLAGDYEKQSAAKRGGGIVHLDWDTADAERRLDSTDQPQATPEQLYLRHWATTVLEVATEQLRRSYEARGKTRLVEVLIPMLTGADAGIGAAATALELSEGATRVALHRLRRRFGEILRATVAETVSDPAEVDTELRELLALVG